MNKEKVLLFESSNLLKIIPYVVLVIGIVLTLSSFITMESIENKCNEHLMQQFQDYQREQDPKLTYDPGTNISIELPWNTD